MSLKIAYTLCSASHLAYAKTMADSFIKYNPGYQVFIGLVDKINNRFDKHFFAPHTLVEIEDMQVPALPQMSSQYTILELSCAMKPFMAQYLLQQYRPDILIYTDTDICYYHSMRSLEQALEEKDILVTPHFITPLDNEKFPDEKEFLRSGLYNAGFLAMKNSQATTDFLQWWSSRLESLCYLNLSQGLGADQNWLNYVPLYFPTASVFRNKGANVAYWNLHERNVTQQNNMLLVNETEPLLFLHLSGYSFKTPDVISKHQTRHQLSNFPVLHNLFQQYSSAVEQNKHSIFSVMTCFYAKLPQKPTGIMATANKILKQIGVKLIRI